MVIPRLVLQACKIVNKQPLLKKICINNISNKRFISIHRSCLAARLYTDKHEWIEVNGKIGTIGISEYAQGALGDVVYAQLPEVDSTLKQDDECGALESVKAASELYTPVSGLVKEKNTQVEDTPSLINSSCYDKGWLFKVELTNDKELSKLMNEDQYKEFLKIHEQH